MEKPVGSVRVIYGDKNEESLSEPCPCENSMVPVAIFSYRVFIASKPCQAVLAVQYFSTREII
jgi:hypothetical protein